MFFETAEFPDELGFGKEGIVNHAGFTELPGGAENTYNQVLNDHSYCCELSTDMCAATGEPPLDQSERCLKWH